MAVIAQYGKGVLTGECRNPYVVLRYGTARPPQFQPDGGIDACRVRGNAYSFGPRWILRKPFLICIAVTRLADAEIKFSKDDAGDN